MATTISNSEGADPPVRILVVEDSDTDFLLLERQLLRLFSRCDLHRANRRGELLAALAENWDVVVSDGHLPDIEGAELVALIGTAAVPCVLVSGSLSALQALTLPPGFVALEKGDHARLRAVLLRFCGDR